MADMASDRGPYHFGEAGIAPLPSLAGVRLRQLSAVQNSCPNEFCRTVLIPLNAEMKKPSDGGLRHFWRRGWDCAFAILGRRAVAPAKRCPIFVSERILSNGSHPAQRRNEKALRWRASSFLAERQGFEPWNTREDVTGIPVQRLRPLGHLSENVNAVGRAAYRIIASIPAELSSQCVRALSFGRCDDTLSVLAKTSDLTQSSALLRTSLCSAPTGAR